MQTIELTHPHSLKEIDLPQTVAAIGFFDGIHKGHQKVIQHAVDEAKKRNMASAVITFFPHPSVVLKPDVNHANYITTLNEKKQILQSLHVDRLYIITFNKALSSLSPQRFIDDFIVGLNIQHLVAGFDYSFGFKGEGNMTNIKDYTHDRFTYTTIDKVKEADEKISSTRIRHLLADGMIEEANDLLGRHFSTTGFVVQGQSRGKDLGYPTANIEVSRDDVLPKQGVYAVKVLYNGETYNAMASLGTNPTFSEDGASLSLEVHILDYQHDLYGEELSIDWYHYIRDQLTFEHVDDLITRMNQDEKSIRQYFHTLT